MPVAEATAIVFLSPMLVVLMAGPVLRERVGMSGGLAAVAGFIGVLLIARPGGGLDCVGVMLDLCAPTANAVYQLLSRMLASTERTMTLLFFLSLIGAPFFLVSMPWFLAGA